MPKTLDPGHHYRIANLESPGSQDIIFLKRSSKMIQHLDEHPGINTQELIRVCIDRSEYLDGVGGCDETKDAMYYLRMALWCYEARAYRRKQQKLNRQAGAVADVGNVNATRDGFDDIPFTEFEIEDRPCGLDGHIIVPQPKTKIRKAANEKLLVPRVHRGKPRPREALAR